MLPSIIDNIINIFYTRPSKFEALSSNRLNRPRTAIVCTLSLLHQIVSCFSLCIPFLFWIMSCKMEISTHYPSRRTIPYKSINSSKISCLPGSWTLEAHIPMRTKKLSSQWLVRSKRTEREKDLINITLIVATLVSHIMMIPP